MRRTSFVVALACLMAIGGAVSAFGLGKASNTDVNLEIKTDSVQAGTAKRPRINAVNLTLLGTTKNGMGQPGTSTALELTLPKGWAWNARKWPASKRCDIKKVIAAKSDSVCPSGSKIGTGKSTATGGADETKPSGKGNGILEEIVVTAHVIKNGNLGFLLEGKPVAVNPPMIEGKLIGRKLSVKIPKTVGEPVAGVTTGITKLNTNFTGTIRVKGRRFGITSNSGGCVAGKWLFRGANVMRDGTVRDTDTVRCRK